MEAKQTHSKGSAGFDVRGVESKHSPTGPDVEALALSLQQHRAVVDCRALEAPKTQVPKA